MFTYACNRGDSHTHTRALNERMNAHTHQHTHTYTQVHFVLHGTEAVQLFATLDILAKTTIWAVFFCRKWFSRNPRWSANMGMQFALFSK